MKEDKSPTMGDAFFFSSSIDENKFNIRSINAGRQLIIF